MSAAKWNISMRQGIDWQRTLTFTDGSSPAQPLHITGPAVLEIRERAGGKRVARITNGAGITINTSAGTVVLRFEDSATSTLKPGRYEFDLFLLMPNGDRDCPVAGYATVEPAVSKP